MVEEGDRIPDVRFRIIEDGRWKDLSTHDVFANKTVVAFGLPGAYTPTCSTAHVPRYEELYDQLRDRGVDQIVCISVNDAFVMDAWKRDQKADHVLFLPDGNGELTEKLGLLVDQRDLGFGARSRRYSMLVRDGVVEKLFIEPDVEGDPYEVSDADTMLHHLDPHAAVEPDILLLTKPGCSHCARAKSFLEEHGLPFSEVTASPRMLRAVSGDVSTPQIFVDGEHIGGADELMRRLESGGSRGQPTKPSPVQPDQPLGK